VHSTPVEDASNYEVQPEHGRRNLERRREEGKSIEPAGCIAERAAFDPDLRSLLLHERDEDGERRARGLDRALRDRLRSLTASAADQGRPAAQA
jgi:hypothetical protein